MDRFKVRPNDIEEAIEGYNWIRMQDNLLAQRMKKQKA